MDPGWDMRSDPAAGVPPGQRLPAGRLVLGRVICHHPFGPGVRLTSCAQYGHINVPEISGQAICGPEHFPAIGTTIIAVVLGYSGARGQLRLPARASRTGKTPD